MQKKKKIFPHPIISVAILFLLTSCGGGGAGASQQAGVSGPPAQQPSPNDPATQPPATESPPTQKLNGDPQVIEYYGDSTIWGFRSGTDSHRVDVPAPDAFAAALPSYHTVRNLGVNATTACGLLNGEGFERDWSQQMAISDATIVIINHAINDTFRYGTERYRNCLSQLVDIARDRGKAVILETPNPADDGRGGESLAAFVRTMKEVAQQKGTYVIDQYAYLRDEWNGTDPYAICPDGVHPSESIYLEKGKFAARQFAGFDRR